MSQSTIGSRLVYQNAKGVIERNGFSARGAVLSQSYLRSEVILNTTATNFRFPIVINDNFTTITNTSVLLNLQDVFIVSRWRIGFAAPSSSTATNFPVCYYPDATVFTVANSATSLYTAYNGYIQVTVNGKVVYPKLSPKNSLAVPTTQGVANAYYSTGPALLGENYGNATGWQVTEPNLFLSGAKQTEVVIQLPSTLAAITTNQRIILEFDGILAQNTTSVR